MDISVAVPSCMLTNPYGSTSIDCESLLLSPGCASVVYNIQVPDNYLCIGGECHYGYLGGSTLLYS